MLNKTSPVSDTVESMEMQMTIPQKSIAEIPGLLASALNCKLTDVVLIPHADAFALVFQNESQGATSNVKSEKGEKNSWLSDLENRLHALSELEIGWDGYSGIPVRQEIDQISRKLMQDLYQDGIPAPSLVPGSDGSMQMEWHIGKFDLEIDILHPNQIEVTQYDIETKNEGYLEITGLDEDLSDVKQWISELKTQSPHKSKNVRKNNETI